MSTEPTLKGVIAGLKAALEEEKTLLLAARFDQIAAITTRKQALGAQLEAMLLDARHAAQAPAFRRGLAAVGALAEENEKLLAAAQAGVRSAQARLQDIVNRQRNVGVYGEMGEKLMTPDAGVSRRKMA